MPRRTIGGRIRRIRAKARGAASAPVRAIIWARSGTRGRRTEESAVDFNTQYQPRKDDVFREIVRESLRRGLDPAEQAHTYAERGKPDFALAYLLVCALT